MATIKQCKMLAARARAAGMDFEFDDFKVLDNGGVDQKLAEIEQFSSEHAQKAEKTEMDIEDEFNGQRFGSVYKIVREKWTDNEIANDRKKFLKAVVEEYQLSIEGEEAVKASFSSSSDKTEALTKAGVHSQPPAAEMW